MKQLLLLTILLFSVLSCSVEEESLPNPSGIVVQCSATTQEGDRCLRKTTNTNGKCWQHGGYSASSSVPASAQPNVTFISSSNNQLANTINGGFNYPTIVYDVPYIAGGKTIEINGEKLNGIQSSNQNIPYYNEELVNNRSSEEYISYGQSIRYFVEGRASLKNATDKTVLKWDKINSTLHLNEIKYKMGLQPDNRTYYYTHSDYYKTSLVLVRYVDKYLISSTTYTK